MAWRNSGMPLLGVYLVNPSLMALMQASLMCCGVSKSGSPAPKPTTSWPSAFICLAFESMASVSEGASAAARLEIRYVIIKPGEITATRGSRKSQKAFLPSEHSGRFWRLLPRQLDALQRFAHNVVCQNEYDHARDVERLGDRPDPRRCSGSFWRQEAARAGQGTRFRHQGI